jgi:8-oxo-dGTP pyrophosphatase MutT (NUDIX family)
MATEKPFKTISSRIAWSCPWYSIRQDEIITLDGSAGVYNVVEKEAAVWIVPVTANGEIVLINHYRYTVDDWCWEVPAGSVKQGQTLEEAAREELREEIGGVEAHLDYIGQFYTADGICNEIGHIFLATQVVLGETKHEPAEIIEIHLKSISEGLTMAKSNQVSDGPSALAILLCANQLERLLDS